MEEAYDGRQVVGMDVHRRRSVLVRMTEDGRRLDTARISNRPVPIQWGVTCMFAASARRLGCTR